MLLDGSRARRDVPENPVRVPAVGLDRLRHIGVVDDQGEAARSGRNAGDLQWRTHASAVAGVLRRYRAVRLKRGTCELHYCCRKRWTLLERVSAVYKFPLP